MEVLDHDDDSRRVGSHNFASVTAFIGSSALGRAFAPTPLLCAIPDVVVFATYLPSSTSSVSSVVYFGGGWEPAFRKSQLRPRSGSSASQQVEAPPARPTKSNSKAISGSDGFMPLFGCSFTRDKSSRSDCGLICLTNCPEPNRGLDLVFTENTK